MKAEFADTFTDRLDVTILASRRFLDSAVYPNPVLDVPQGIMPFVEYV